MKDNFLNCIIYLHSEEEENHLTCLLSNFKSINLILCLHNPAETMESLNKHKPAIIFMDIENANFLNCVQKPPFIVGICEKKHMRNLKKYLSLGFYDFLPNPISTEDFHNVMGKILNTHIPNKYLKKDIPFAAEDEPHYDNLLLEKALFTKESIFLKGNRKYESLRILFDDVEYLNIINNEVVIHFENGTTRSMRTTLKYFQNKLPNEKFQKINKNTIINIDKIVKIMKNDKVLVNNNTFKISRIFKKILREKLEL